jgi:C_GCAxxG_C_C family probable redox protein
MTATDESVARFQSGFNCAASVFSVQAERLGLDRETAVRVAGAFGGGIARTGETCGAVTGALMALGLRHAATRAEDKETKERMYEIAKDFLARFKARGHALRCKDLLGIDVSTHEGHELARERGLFRDVCPGLVRDAAEILEEMLDRAE